MNPTKFNYLVNEFTEREDRILHWKAGEYSDGVDRLQNFREVASLVGVSTSEVALMYLLKHIQSIKNAIIENRVNWCWEDDGGEGTKQRIADSRNYLLLLAACIDEKEEEGKKGD